MKVGVSSWFGNITEYEQRLRLGAFDKPYPVTDADQFRRELMLADMVEPLGFDSFWTIEHHFTPYGMTNNPTQLLTYMAGRTKKIELGTMVLVLPWHEPLKLAENLVLLDVLMDGRKLHIGTGRGFATREFSSLGIPYEDSRERMMEVLDVVRVALTNEFFTYDGRFFKIPRTSIRPRPITEDMTRNILMTWNSPESLDAAANSGVAPLFTNYRGWDALRTELGAFNKIRAKNGWEPSPSAIAVTVHVDEDGQRARELGEKYWRRTVETIIWHYDKYASPFFMPDATPAERDAVLDKGYESQASAGLFGTPAEVTEQIRELQKVANVGHLMTLHSFGDMPIEDTEKSMRLFASKVLPTIRTFGNDEPLAVPYSQVLRDKKSGKAA